MDIKSAQYLTEKAHIRAVGDGKVWVVPVNPKNRHYAEIMRQVEAGTLIIQDAEPEPDV